MLPPCSFRQENAMHTAALPGGPRAHLPACGLQEARSSTAPGPAHMAQTELPSLTRNGATRPLRPPPPTAPALLTLPRPWRSRWVRSPPGFLLQIQTQAAPVSGADRPGAPARPAPAAMPRGPRGSRPAGPRRHRGHSPGTAARRCTERGRARRRALL